MPGTRPQMQNVVGADREVDVFFTQLAEDGHRLILLLLAAAVQYSSRAVRCGFQLFVDIVIYLERLRGKGVQMPETRPKMHDVVVVDSEENVQLDSWQREASGLFLALGSSISTQLEGGSIWILVFR